MPKLNLQRYTLGVLDWDLKPNKIEDLLEPHDSLDGLYRYCLELKQSPSKFWPDTDWNTPIKMWSDGVFVHGKANNFQKCWYCGLPEYILFEILRSFKAKVLIAQVQMAPGCQSCLELYFEGGPDEVPKFVEVKIVIYTNYKIENPTNFLANFFRKWWKPSGEYRDFCSIKELLAPDPDEETNPDGEFDPSWETLRQIEMMVERQKTPLEE